MKTIIIDAAHGGESTGIVGPAGTIEKDVNLSLALDLRDKLLGYNVNIKLTRQDDYHVSMRTLIELCTSCELLLQLHCGGHGQRDPIELWTYCKSNSYVAEFAKALSRELSRSLQAPSNIVKDSQSKFKLLERAPNSIMLFTGILHTPAGEQRILDPEWVPSVSGCLFRTFVDVLAL